MNQFVLANYVKIFKKYSNKYSNDVLCLNDLIQLITEPLKIHNKDGESYYLCKADVSDIINRKEEVPRYVKDGALRVDFQSVVNGCEDLLYGIEKESIENVIEEIAKLYSNKNDINYSQALEISFNECKNNPSLFIAKTFLQCLKNDNKLNYEKLFLKEVPGRFLLMREIF